MRTIEQIRPEIQERFGFVPPFFEPAQENPQVLEHLWQQTVSAYAGNPLLPLFKEKLSAYLSRYCDIPYCMICHSCSLHQLGMNAQEVLKLLEAPPPTVRDIDKHLGVLASVADMTVFPEPNSALEESLLQCSIYIFLEKYETEHIRAEMRRVLGRANYQHLVTFVAYVKSCHVWMEAHPEVAYEADQRAIDHLSTLYEEEPSLAEFFRNYRDRVNRECQSRAEQLAEIAERKRNEAALRQSEERLRLALETTRTGIWDWNMIANKVDWSDNFDLVFGLVPGTFSQTCEGFFKCVHPEDRELVTSSVAEAIERGTDQDIEFRVIWPDSSIRWMAGQGKVFYDETGKAVRAIGTVRDITKRKQAEEEIRQTQSFLDSIVENIPHMIFVKEAQGLKFVRFNKAGEELTGFSKQELLGKNDQDIFPKEVADRYNARDKEALSEGKVLDIPEETIQTKEQGLRLLHTKKIPILDASGKPQYLLGISEDITVIKQANEELQRQNQKLLLFSDIALKIRESLQLEEILQTTVTEVQKILQADRVLIYRLWPNGTGSGVTEAVVPGWPKILGQSFSKEVFPEEYRKLYSQGRIRSISNVEDDNSVQPCLVEFLRRFGVKAKLVVPILQQQNLWGLLIAHQCGQTRQWQSFEVELLQQLATQVGIALAQAQLLEEETRRRQELISYNAELQHFAYVASHDLQEPLRKVRAFGDRLKTKCGSALTDQGLDYLERMQNAAERMQTLIDDLLTFSRVTSKAQPFVRVSLTQVAQEVLSDLEVRVQQTCGRVEVGELPTIDADPLQMRQLLQNLISNALKFHRSDEPPMVKIRSQLIQEAEQQRAVSSPATVETLNLTALHYQIIVEDNGIGFELKYLDRIFNVFQRLHGRSEYDGTGMGLAICRKIAERHGGSITATSIPGQGATFIVTLPVKQNKGENA